jgi:hypothetical protein
MSTLHIDDHGLVSAGPASIRPSRSFAYIAGHQYEHGGATRRFVSLALHGAKSPLEEPLYAAAHLSPDEARGLAYRLLDAADEADENFDAPVEYALTGKR